MLDCRRWQQSSALPRRNYHGTRLIGKRRVANFLGEVLDRLLKHSRLKLGLEDGEVEHNEGLRGFYAVARERLRHARLSSRRRPIEDLEQLLTNDAVVIARLRNPVLDLGAVVLDERLP